MITLALEHLFDRVSESMTLDQINARNVFGARELGRIDFELPTIVWVPGDSGGGLGELGGPRYPGSAPQPVADLGELFTVQILGFDPRDPESERAQYRVARFLYEVWLVAVYRAALGNFRVRSQTWQRGRTTDRSYGAMIRAVCELSSPIVDALPDEPLVGGAFAGLSNAVDAVAFAEANDRAFLAELTLELEVPEVEAPAPPPDDLVESSVISGVPHVQPSAAFGAVFTVANKQMVCRVTAHDGDLAVDVGVQVQPVPGAYVSIDIDGWTASVGDGTKVGCVAYFSGDLGATARRWGEVMLGDTVHFNGSVAGAQLGPGDRMSLNFEGVV